MAMPGDKEGEHAVLPADKVLKLPSCAASALWRDRIILANELSMRKHIVERSLLAVAKEAVISSRKYLHSRASAKAKLAATHE
jgi:hypothetical protein